ncbi:RNA dependent RNA polymerase-domain-containing protein [Schizophyllum fasciatum]
MPFRPRSRDQSHSSANLDSSPASLGRTRSSDKFYYETQIPSQVYDGSLTDVLAGPSDIDPESPVPSLVSGHLTDSTSSRKHESQEPHTPSPLATKRKRDDEHALGEDALWQTAKAIKTEQEALLPPPTMITDEAVILAHDNGVQRLMDEYELSDGVKWEMARLRSLGRIQSYDELTSEKLSLLCGPNNDAAERAARTLLNMVECNDSDETISAQEKSLISPWAELDTEIETLKLDPNAGLGNSSVRPGWYGGKVLFPLRIKEDKKGKGKGKGRHQAGPGYTIVLDHASLSSSTRFARRCGSTAFLRVKVAMGILRSRPGEMLNLFLKPFVLWDRVFRAFFAKDDNVFLVCTNETMDITGRLQTVDNGRQSLRDFVEFHNPLRVGDRQLLCKWASRMALGLSNSVPGPRVDPSDIFEIPDIVSTDGTNSDLTDGCGLCNKTLPMMVYHQLTLDGVPAAVQFRLGGMKGLLLQQPHSAPCERPQVSYRPSQLKIRGQLEHPAHLTIDLLRTSRMRVSVAISAEVIRNLEDNGVPRSTLAKLFKARIAEVMDGLTSWDGPNGMLKLWATLERLGGVLTQRRMTAASGEARARGLGSNFDRIEDDADDDDDEPDEFGFDVGLQRRSVAWVADHVSGCPSRLEETVMMLLDSGFTPDNSSICREKLREIYLSRARILTSKIRFTVPQSASAFVVPDPCGVLGPNEIHLKCSRPSLITDDGIDTDIIVGDVLITRNPCKVPSDVRKVRAVSHPELACYVDVIVVSAHPSTQRLLELLAGGDYDGDTCIVIWDKSIVEPFRNSDTSYATPDNSILRLQFSRDTLTVDQFMQSDAEDQTTEMQKYLLSNLRDVTQLGIYSTFHETAIYKYGYAQWRTVRLAHVFNTLMDAAKTGYKLTERAWNDDRSQYQHQVGPLYRELAKTRRRKNKTEHGADEYLSRCTKDSRYSRYPDDRFFRQQGTEIMDYLVAVAKHEYDALCIRMDDKFKNLSLGDAQKDIPPDMDLAKPWFDAVARAKALPGLGCDLGAIAAHVHRVYAEKSPVVTDQRIEERQDQLRALSKKFVSGPPLQDMQVLFEEAQIRRLAASYAYIYDWRKISSYRNRHIGDGYSRFPWNVAFRELCQIKATAIGPSKTVSSEFYEHFKLAKV